MLETLKELLHFSFCKRAFIGVRVDVFKEANQMMELSALDELFCTQNVQLEEVKSTAVEWGVKRQLRKEVKGIIMGIIKPFFLLYFAWKEDIMTVEYSAAQNDASLIDCSDVPH